jgi:hypothetical protein
LSRVGPFGSGPYMYSGYDEQNLVHHLVKFNDYFRRAALESEGFYQIQDYYVQYIPGLTAAVAALRYGNVQVLDSQYHLETSLGVLDPAWSSYVAYQAFDVQELGFNMMNPIWGTGLGTPLGQAHPELAAEAAKHVRRAFEYLVPKDLIIKNITGGQASYGITTPITPITGLNDNIVPRNETIENARLLAMQELREAGYNFLPPGELNVQVINSRGIPIDSASVVSFVQPPGQEPLAGLTNTFGNISFTNLIPGNYILRVTKSGYPDAYGNTTVLANQTTSITFVLASTALQLLLNTDKPEYLVNESISITATLLYNGLPVSMAITSVEVRDPGNNLVYISTRQTDGAGICTFTFNAGLNWQTGKYAVFGVSYIDGLGDASALTSFQIVRLVSDVRIESLWVHNPSLITAQNLTLGPLGNYWATGALMNYGNGSAFVSKMTFKYPANLPANYVQAILATPFGNLTYLSYVEIDNTICVYNVTLPRYSVLAVIVDTNITRSASYTSVTKADWQDTHFLTKGSGSKSLTLNAVWDTSNPVIITSFRNTGTNSTGGYINVRATLKNVGVANVTFVCIVQVTDSHGAPLTPVIQSVKLVPGQSLVVNIRVNIPSSAPKGTYAINFSLYTDLPSKGGHAINYELATATIH